MANGTGNGAVESNQGQIKLIVRTLASICGLCVAGIFGLIYFSKEIPTELWLLTNGIVTALIAMLVKTTPTPSSPPVEKKPEPIETTNALP